jgi:hypothetical protein
MGGRRPRISFSENLQHSPAWGILLWFPVPEMKHGHLFTNQLEDRREATTLLGAPVYGRACRLFVPSTMKTKLSSLIAVGLCLIGLAASAQTNGPTGTVPANTGTFLNTVQDYFTSFNTNLDGTFGLSKASLWTGVDSIQGGAVPLANELGVSYSLYKSLSAENVIRNSGVAGTLVSDQLGFGFNVIVHDARLTLYADGGYDIAASNTVNAKGKTVHPDRLFGEVGIRAAKALTEHTYGWIGVGAQLPKNSQVFSAGIGVTF